MIGHRRRYGAFAITAQISCNDGELLGKRRGNPMPHDKALGKTVQQQQRRAAAADNSRYLGAGNGDSLAFELWEKIRRRRHGRRRQLRTSAA